MELNGVSFQWTILFLFHLFHLEFGLQVPHFLKDCYELRKNIVFLSQKRCTYSDLKHVVGKCVFHGGAYQNSFAHSLSLCIYIYMYMMVIITKLKDNISQIEAHA